MSDNGADISRILCSIHRRKLLTGLVLLIICFPTALCEAAVITDQFGDIDGFGIGATGGGAFDYLAIGDGDGDGTDEWRVGNGKGIRSELAWEHSYPIPSSEILSATLEVFHGGIRYRSQYSGLKLNIIVDGVAVGGLSPGDGSEVGQNMAFKDTFDLTPHLHRFEGPLTVEIDTYSGDGWVLDYSLLTIVVPEPTTVAMATMSCVLMVSRSRSRIT